MDDPYIFAESLDDKTIEYAKVETGKFKDKFGCKSQSLRQKAAHFNGTRKAIQAMKRGDRLIVLYQEEKNYFVNVDGSTIFSTGDVIPWIDVDDEGDRIAIFSTEGSDYGTLKIFENEKEIEEIKGVISSIQFTDSSFYIVKTFAEGEAPDGGPANCHRVLKDNNVVFGTGMGSNDFISLHKSKAKVIVSVGDWTHTRLYSGLADDPTTWTLDREVPVPAKPLGFLGDTPVYLEQRGNGVVKKGDEVVLEGVNPIEDCCIVREGFLVTYLVDAKIYPALYDFDGSEQDSLKLGGQPGLRYLDSNGSDALMITMSFGLPYAIYSYQGGVLTLIEENKVLDLDVTERWVENGEVRIHFFQISPRDSDPDTALVYGYGGFNISLSPMFSPLFATLLQEGVSVVVANLRGGGEFGEEWHKAGMKELKQNVFDDFISVMSLLKNEGKSLVAMGASNGGLLVGTILTQRPDLLKGAIIGNPVLDMLRFHLMSVGKYWTSEYGNPDNEEDARYLAKYSPYHNIAEAEYPPSLIYTRLNDDRVHPAHALKFHMKLSKVTQNAYIRVSTSGGHIGISPSEMITEICETSNFILDCLS